MSTTFDANTSTWQDRERPRTAEQWIERAAEVAAVLSADAVERDRAGRTPHHEVQLLKDAGLVTLLGPAENGGGGQTWSTAYRVTREVAKGDGSIGQLLGYHYLWAWAVRLVGTDEQISRTEQHYTANDLFFGGAVNPRDNDLTIADEGETIIYNGRKSFSTGSGVSDLTVLEGVLEGTDQHVFAVVPSQQQGITFHDDWDNLGQRLTESGSVSIEDVRVCWDEALGYVDRQFQARTYATLNTPTIQLVFANFYLGIAQGALEAATSYTREKTRPWPYGGDNKESAAEEFYVLDGYGDLQSKLWSAESLIEDTNARLEELLHADRDDVTAHQRGEVEVRIAAAKQRIIDTGLEIATRAFELTGARATANKNGLDIYWRNLRTHSLHDPVAYKRKEVGQYALLGEHPEPTWYT